MKISTPGKYTFYLFSGNSLATAEVNVVEKLEFEIFASAKNNASIGENFIVTITAKNIVGDFRTADITVEFDGFSSQKSATFGPYEKKAFEFNLTAKELGNRKIIVSLVSDSIYTYIEDIEVYKPEEKKGIADSIIDGLRNFIDSIIRTLENLIGGR
jgi:hypothetical protein